MISSEVKHLLIDKMKLISLSDKNICLVGPINLPVQLEEQVVHFKWYTWLAVEEHVSKDEILDSLPNLDLASLQQCSVLVYGDIQDAEKALVRMHSICHTGDIFGSKRCDCGYQLRTSMQMIVENGSGALFYLANHEGRGIGLFSKSFAYLLQQEGYDTVEANLALGFTDDSRSYDEAISVLQSLRSKPVTLITNNPKKLAALKESGLLADEHIPLWGDKSEYNEFYLETKVNKSGHIPEKEPIGR
ncbi:GTP cyclohydrolase II [Heyndrickxia oleronia]|uniref:GTP cyclohydrolase II n=1 Tax=Heyndrickxia oleronia TaxID=38875 RepID=A0A8E2LGH5_9BACI|nr:GTP cyclohydrolase II [Heyndrickxia oleronia]MEC1372987.1 GTP cyclohydrolase II [Heyndrickxia oleronia]NYV68176.1 GTP cyclohydrolase II [Bacillus sp. Gen3]OOP69169.1 GTP cyclohydrolase [Heyndrickxia oleronia]QQZ03811.1 GTP cyclohydrolase II [Heyndrickxia oleronia]